MRRPASPVLPAVAALALVAGAAVAVRPAAQAAAERGARTAARAALSFAASWLASDRERPEERLAVSLESAWRTTPWGERVADTAEPGPGPCRDARRCPRVHSES